MTRWIVMALSVLASATTLAGELDAYETAGDKAIYCFAVNNLRMQLSGVIATDPTQASNLIGQVGRWQTIIEREHADPAGQAATLHNAMQQLNDRLKTARGNAAAMAQTVAPITAECDTLLARLEQPAAPADIAPAASAETAAPAPAAATSGPNDADVFAGLVQTSRFADFRWNPHSDIYAKIKGRGELRRIRNGFRLEFETRIKTLCVGDLIEARRSEDGYLMHLEVPADSGQGCMPRVTRGLLFPMAFDEKPENRRLMLRLFDDQNRLITAMRFESRALEAKRLDAQKLTGMYKRVVAIEQDQDDQRRADKLARLKRHPDFARLEPFYNSCAFGQPEAIDSAEANFYCICMTYKFGVGERIPEAEFQSYVQDFTRLTRKVGVYTDDNKMYTRLGEECRACSDADRTLRAGCDTPDNAMLLPSTFAGVIEQMEKDELRLESSEFYKENFFVIYLQGYSDQCSELINDPIPFEYVVTETTTDPYGFSYTDEIQRDRTYVARRHADRYEAIYDKHAKLSPEQFFGAMRDMAVRNEADLRRLQSDTQRRYEIEAEKRYAVRDHLAKGCTSAPVQRVYSRLDALFE